MSEQRSGLRFDIYERVHLPERVPAIQELDEVELSPHIEVAVEGEQAVVRGSLLLTGTYSGQADGDTRSALKFEHTIPVEITLPMNRIRSVEDISVEIDNFDVDLLSSRSLNVTGVLSLHGVEIVSGNADSWREEEEIVFVHEAGQEGGTPGAGAGEALRTESETPEDAALAQTTDNRPEAGRKREEIGKDTLEDFSLLDHDDEESPDGPDESNKPQAEIGEQNVQPVFAPAEPDKSGMKIAFGSKQAEEAQPFDLKTYLSKTDEFRNAETPASSAVASPPPQTDRVFRPERTSGAERSQAPSEQEPVASTDALEWKNLFISGNEVQQFRKVRICIVQKEDTLESIAKKYERKPQEIRLYNRLSDSEVFEGQIIYIP